MPREGSLARRRRTSPADTEPSVALEPRDRAFDGSSASVTPEHLPVRRHGWWRRERALA